MSRIVFVGPSVAGLDLARYAGLELRPPVCQGDVWRAARAAPEAIGIIDGYFEGVPSVWHKEILWAMHQGIPVLGASSMGALRAAEMDAFGMEGIGQIFESYRNGTIEDDDEVALVHGPAEIGSPPLSLPLVNVRATCAAAEKTGRPTGDTIAKAKAQFYKTRTWDTVLAAADIPPETAEWLRANPVDQKRIDAQALLERMMTGDLTAPKISEPFEMTSQWVRAIRDWSRNRREVPMKPKERLLG